MEAPRPSCSHRVPRDLQVQGGGVNTKLSCDNPEEAWHNLKVPINESLEEICGRSPKRQWRKKTWWWNEHVNATIKEKRARFRAHRDLRKRGNTREARAALVAYHEAKRTTRREIALAKSSAGEAMFREVDPKGSTVYRIARQMVREN